MEYSFFLHIVEKESTVLMMTEQVKIECSDLPVNDLRGFSFGAVALKHFLICYLPLPPLLEKINKTHNLMASVGTHFH